MKNFFIKPKTGLENQNRVTFLFTQILCVIQLFGTLNIHGQTLAETIGAITNDNDILTLPGEQIREVGTTQNTIARNKFLLLDGRIIEEVNNAELQVGNVTKHPGNPLFIEDKPWEVRFDNLYGNILYDEDDKIYKCWYSPFIVDSSSMGMSLNERKRKYTPPRGIREMGICYATSHDGLKWEKPEMGLVEYQGNKQNNLVKRGPHGAGVFKDMYDPDPLRRYKMIFRGIIVGFSPDGITWNNEVKIEGVNVRGDTHNNAFWAPALNKYVGITRTFGELGREVARIESDDFIHWTKEEIVLKAIEKDLQPYSMPVFYYGGVYLGLVSIHQQSSDRVWTELTWSPDSKKWYRISPGIPLIPCSEEKLAYDYGCVYACAYPIVIDGEIRLYYGGSDWLHTSWRNGSLNLAILRMDGYAGYKQINAAVSSTVITKKIPYKGQDISINADILKTGGWVKVSVLDTNGNKIAKAKTVSDTATDKILKFNKDIDLEEIKLRFEFSNAKIYSFTFN